MKLYIYIEYDCTAANFCRGVTDHCFEARTTPPDEHWSNKAIFCGEVEIDERLIDTAAVLKMATDGLDKSEKNIWSEYVSKMDEIEKRRGELLALPGGGQ